MVRTIVFLGLLAICAFLAGWFTIDRTDSETTIRFNRDEIRADTSKAIAKGRELLNQDGSQQQGYDQSTAQPATDGYYAPYAPQTGTYNGDYIQTPQQATRTVPPWQQPAPTTGGQQY